MKLIKLFKILTTLVLTISLFVSVTNPVYAGCAHECVDNQSDCGTACQDCTWCVSNVGKISNPVLSTTLSGITGSDFLGRFISLGINLGFLVGILVFFFTLISGAIKWLSSGSDKTHIEGAQKQITNALIGLVILFAIFAIINLVEYLFGISITKFNIPTL